MISALYIDPRGPYPALLGADACWDESRDARLYEGPGAVVAHPPCGPWSTMRHLYKGAEHDCAERALCQVRLHGGVLEHPAKSKLWDAERIPKPQIQSVGMSYGDRDRFGFTIEVDQCDWGHVARKRTWLYIVGVPWIDVARAYDARPFKGAVPTHWASGSRGASTTRKGAPVPPGIKVCSARQRRRTPEAFAKFLIHLAELARV